MKREKPYRTIETILQSPRKDFIPILNRIQLIQKEKKQSQSQQTQSQNRKKKPTSYDRYGWDPKEVMEENLKGTDILSQIDTKGSMQKKEESHSRKRKVSDRRSSRSSSHHHRDTTPIIIVPTALSLITLYNAQDFIIDGTYSNSEEKKKRNKKKDFNLYL